MTDLSPAAQAVLDAFLAGNWESTKDRQRLAAALQAAADQVLPLYMCSLGSTRGTTRLGVRQKLLAIAAELESSNG